MKFEVEMTDKLLQDANDNLVTYDLGSEDQAEVLKTIILLWFDSEFDGDDTFWDHVTNNLKVIVL